MITAPSAITTLYEGCLYPGPHPSNAIVEPSLGTTITRWWTRRCT